MKLHRKKEASLSSRDEKLAIKIANRIIHLERSLAVTMNDMLAGLPTKRRNAVLILLSVLFAAYNMYLLISSITN